MNKYRCQVEIYFESVCLIWEGYADDADSAYEEARTWAENYDDAVPIESIDIEEIRLIENAPEPRFLDPNQIDWVAQQIEGNQNEKTLA